MAPSKPAPRSDNLLLRAFSFYAAYHNNFTNQLIHAVFVPTILVTALIFLTALPLPFALPKLVVDATGVAQPSAALVVAAGNALYYLVLAASARLTGVGSTASVLVGLAWLGAETAARHYGGAVFAPAIAIHVLAWVAQFYGHGVHEGRAPALLDNLFQALVMAPFFVFIELLFWVGLLKDFRAAARAEVDKRLALFRAEFKQLAEKRP